MGQGPGRGWIFLFRSYRAGNTDVCKGLEIIDSIILCERSLITNQIRKAIFHGNNHKLKPSALIQEIVIEIVLNEVIVFGETPNAVCLGENVAHCSLSER